MSIVASPTHACPKAGPHGGGTDIRDDLGDIPAVAEDLFVDFTALSC